MDLLTHDELAKLLQKEKIGHYDLILLEHHIDCIGKLLLEHELEHDIEYTLKIDLAKIVDRLEIEYKQITGIGINEQ